MSKRNVILVLVACLSMGVFAQQLFSQGTGSGGFSSGSGSMGSRGHRSQRMPGQPDIERMRNMSHEEKMQYFQQLAEEQRKAAEQQESIAMQQALGADNDQWKVIEPRLKKVKHYREQAFVGTKPPFQSNFSSFSTGPGGAQGFSGGFSGGFQFQAGGGSSMQGGNMVPMTGGRQAFDGSLSDGEIICQELENMLYDPQTTPVQVSQKLDALRKAREKARRQWVAAQQQLREVLDFRQQAKLVMMGLLD